MVNDKNYCNEIYCNSKEVKEVILDLGGVEHIK
jgi:hypothetical protein